MMILHHYDNSPYAEKIRLMLGYSNSSWYSLPSPAWPPRPNVDPLSGGYRRIPIAQIGADVFCDSSLIAKEIAVASNEPGLDPASAQGQARELMTKAEGEGFFSAISSVPPYKLIGTLLGSFGPVGAYRFVKDRGGLLKGGTSKPQRGPQAKTTLQELFGALDELLNNQTWVGGDSPNVADFSIYHPIWLHLSCGGALPEDASALGRWYADVAQIGHGDPREITQEEAFASARDSDPRELPSSPDASGDDTSGCTIGDAVEVAPSDYGVVPVVGTLAALTDERIIVARETSEFGELHVHFPRAYTIKAT